MLFALDGVQQSALKMDELLPLFDPCKKFSSPSICKKVTDLRYFRRFEIMDNITKLRGSSF